MRISGWIFLWGDRQLLPYHHLYSVFLKIVRCSRTNLLIFWCKVRTSDPSNCKCEPPELAQKSLSLTREIGDNQVPLLIAQKIEELLLFFILLYRINMCEFLYTPCSHFEVTTQPYTIIKCVFSLSSMQGQGGLLRARSFLFPPKL